MIVRVIPIPRQKYEATCSSCGRWHGTNQPSLLPERCMGCDRELAPIARTPA